MAVFTMNFLFAALIFICLLPTQSLEIKNVAVSSDVVFGRCEDKKVFKIQHGSSIAHIPCNSTPIIPHKFKGRLGEDKTGYVTLRNVTRSDAGHYILERTNGNGINDQPTKVEVRVIDPVWIHHLYYNNTNRTISFTVANGEDLGTITWKMDEDLLPWHSRSLDNRTLTIPYNHTGAIMVNVSNLVTADYKSITLISGLSGNSSHLCDLMYLNTTKLGWDNGGGHTGSWTLTLPRNISNICVQIPSDEMREPQSRSHGFAVIGALVAVVCVVLLLRKKCDKCKKQTEQDREMDENKKNRFLEKNGSAAKDWVAVSTCGDDATAKD